ncbi:MAG: DUF4886 domain-containing protein [Bacteroidales bacterium]|nr:DUF4886 domain-containing protein [Bacteroidales bacterium]
MIGNSFTDDATEYIGEIVRHSNINAKKCCLYKATMGESQLQTWENKYKKNVPIVIERKAGLLSMDITEGTLKEIFHQHWDVISIQQLSRYSNNISSFSPYIDNLLSYIKQDCLNDNVAICWHLTWSYWNEYDATGPKGFSGWSSIVSTVDQIIQMYNIDMVIPSGTAIQNARATELNTEKSLTRDGYHMDYGLGRYITACTVYESLFEPFYKQSITDIIWHPQSINDTQAQMARSCVKNAVENWHNAPFIMSDSLEYSVFPNPTTDSIFVFLKSTDDMISCSIYDINGKRVFKEKIPANNLHVIDISKLQRGTYSIQFKGEKMVKTQRIEKL